MRILSNFCAVTALVFLIGCNDDDDRFEKIAKLRGLGLVTSPVVAPPSTDSAVSKVQMTFYAAMPLGGTVTAEPYSDLQGSLRKIELPLTIDGVEYEDHASLRLAKIKATATVPTANLIYFDPDNGFATVRYAVSLKSNEGLQIMVGNLVVYPEGSAQLISRNNLPKLSITTPTKDSAIGNSKQEIKAEITEVNDETFRVGWFVSGGKIDTRNAVKANWEPSGSGKFTVIVTARGTKTSAFGIDVIDVTAN
ncbi:MAG: hypothetical protein NTY08_14235 [Proteobacteria bacterium]|nr:hypothetical protein [Pseudomonadota bacterium]